MLNISSCTLRRYSCLKLPENDDFFHLFMRLQARHSQAIFALSLKHKIMKGTYINTVIMMAALSGRNNKKTGAAKETVISLDNYKVIWSKNNKGNKPVANVSKTSLIY